MSQNKSRAARIEQALRGPHDSQNGNSMPPPSLDHSGSLVEVADSNRHFAEDLQAVREWGSGENGKRWSPELDTAARLGNGSSSDWALYARQRVPDEHRRHTHQSIGLAGDVAEDSKWIDRDKLAKIESEELQAAGFVIPGARATSKQRRPQGQLSDDIDGVQPWPDSPTESIPEERQNVEGSSTPVWDLRIPEEIARSEKEADAQAYFTKHEVKGGSRIPVARISPAPIPQDYLERESPSVRRNDFSETDTIAYPKPRARSASTSTKETKELEMASNSTRAMHAKRTPVDTSPNRSRARQTSTASKSSAVAGRPKTRSGSSRDMTGSRPFTRSSEPAAASHQPEGDPPWALGTYKPDPRLPPDQQLLPTVAKRLRQEQWEKEGRFGDAYDTEFRPINDHKLPQPQDREVVREPVPTEEPPEEHQEIDAGQHSGGWPLKANTVKSPKQTSYSTMPKISDLPTISPQTSHRSHRSPNPLAGGAPKAPRAEASTPNRDKEADKEKERAEQKKESCGCCVVM